MVMKDKKEVRGIGNKLPVCVNKHQKTTFVVGCYNKHKQLYTYVSGIDQDIGIIIFTQILSKARHYSELNIKDAIQLINRRLNFGDYEILQVSSLSVLNQVAYFEGVNVFDDDYKSPETKLLEAIVKGNNDDE